jgi:transposase-like protein
MGTLLEQGRAVSQHCTMIKRSPFKYFKISPEIIRLAVMMCCQFLLSLRNVEDRAGCENLNSRDR